MSRGSIETPLMGKAWALEGVTPGFHPTPINRMGTAEEVGNLVAFLLSDDASFISGATYAIDGAWCVLFTNKQSLKPYTDSLKGVLMHISLSI